MSVGVDQHEQHVEFKVRARLDVQVSGTYDIEQ